MSWPIGYGKTGFHYATSPDGTVRVDGVAVSEPDGWIVLQRPEGEAWHGHVTEASIRVRLVVDPVGRAFLYAEQVEVGPLRFSGVHAWAQNGGGHWLQRLTECVHRAIERRLEEHGRVGAANTAPATARATPASTHPSIAADDTWRGARALDADGLRDAGDRQTAEEILSAPTSRVRRRRRTTGDATR